MKDKLLPRSGLDFGAMMDEIDDQKDLKSIAAGQGLWLSSKALVVVLGVFELLLVVVGVVVFYWTKAKFTYTSYDDLYVEHIGNPDLQL